jgi:hypothetical protein
VYRIAWRKVRLVAAGLFTLTVVPAVWAGNTCRDTIRPTCQYIGTVRIRCCQILSNHYNYGPCLCKQYRDSQGYTHYLSGGIEDTGPSCEPQDDVCC